MERYGFRNGGLVVLFKLIALSASLSVQADTAAYYRFGDDRWLYSDSSGNGNLLEQVAEEEVQAASLASGLPERISQTGATNRFSAKLPIGTNGAVMALQAADAPGLYSSEFTVEAFAKPSVFRSLSVIAGQWNEPSGRAWRLLLNKKEAPDPDRLVFQISSNGTNFSTVTMDISLSKYAVYYFAASVQTNASGSSITLYCQKNGGPLVSTNKNLNVTLFDTDAPLLVGASLKDGTIRSDNQFGGSLDEVRLSRRALTEEQLLVSTGVVYYVSPFGSDSNNGLSIDQPFQTVERAQQDVRQQVTNSTKNIRVWLRGGTYTLNEPVKFSEADGGMLPQTVTYQAWDDEVPVFCSDEPLSGWNLINSQSGLPVGCPPQAVGQLYWTDVSGIVAARSNLIASGESILPHPRITELYDAISGEKMEQSSTKGFEPETAYGTPDYLGGKRYDVLAYPEGVLTNYADLTDAELHIVPGHDWTMNILPLTDRINTTDRLVETAIDSMYHLCSNKKSWLWPCAWIRNVPWGLAPGRWFYSGNEQRIYYWPQNGAPPADGQLAASNGMLEYFLVQGNITPVEGLVFKGLTFTRGARNTWTEGYKSTRWRSSWAAYDEANALLRFRGAEDCRVNDCRFINSAAAGVRLDLHCQGIRITDCEFGHLGESGAILSGYGPGYPDENFGNVVENNWFHHIGEAYWHSPAVFIAQSGNNYIARNLIHDCGYDGIMITGLKDFHRGSTKISQGLINWNHPDLQGEDYMLYPTNVPLLYASNNIVTGNEIFRVMEANMGDGNALYLQTAPFGNEITYNYCHDIRGNAASAIRADGWQWGTLFANNVICRSTGQGIIIKGENSAINNYIINPKDGFTVSGTNTVSLAVLKGPNTNAVIRNNLYVQTEGPQHPGFYKIETVDDNRLISTNDMVVDSNLFWFAGASNVVNQYLSDFRQEFPRFDANSINADPLFEDWQNDDFRLQSGSPAIPLGMESLDVRECGLREPFRSEVYLCPTGRVTIAPKSGLFTGSTHITISAPAGAEVRYTLDGSEPDTESTLYSTPFMVTNPLTVRARIFESGRVDRLGAKTILYPWTKPIYENFGLEWGSVSRSRMTVIDTEKVTHVAAPGSGHGRSLKLNADGDSLKSCSFYELVHGFGTVETACDIFFENTNNLCLKIQWRDARQTGDGSYNVIGPHLQLSEGGALECNGTVLTRLQTNVWTRLTLETDLGNGSSSNFVLTVNPEGAPQEVYTFLPYQDAGFEALDYLTFLIGGTRSVYVDNMSIRKLNE